MMISIFPTIKFDNQQILVCNVYSQCFNNKIYLKSRAFLDFICFGSHILYSPAKFILMQLFYRKRLL